MNKNEKKSHKSSGSRASCDARVQAKERRQLCKHHMHPNFSMETYNSNLDLGKHEYFDYRSKHEKGLERKKAHCVCQIIWSDYLSCAIYREALTLQSS